MNTHFDELIAKHLQGSLTGEEEQLLAVILKVPENQLYLAAKIDGQFIDPSLVEVGDEATGRQIFQGIQQKLNKDIGDETQQPAEVVQLPWYKTRRAWLAAAVAAAILLVISLSGILFTGKNQDEQPIAVHNSNVSDSTLAVVRHEVNTTGREESLLLSDGSIIILADKSEVSYREPFANKRDISLIGKAYFKVAKDKTRPFTVLSGAISTTAVGTEFTVTAFRNANRIRVRLYEGKVVVKPVEKGNPKLKKDIYLLPGQEFIYNTQVTAKVRPFKLNNEMAPEEIMKEEQAQDSPPVPQNAQGSWYMFNNESLGGVFDQLADMYNVKIVYDKKDVEKLYFVGKFNKSDSLDIILKYIATANSLTITKKDNTYIISK